jgi:CheY-like chemotaxis protein
MTHVTNLDILLVEDDDDIRTMLIMALEDDGYTVEGVADAETGLERLRERAYHLLVSDYMLPGRDGAWLMREATRAPRAVDTARIMITAHPAPEPVEGVTVLRKPLDLDTFFDTIHEKLAPARAAEAERLKMTLSADAAGGQDDGRLEFVLYISSASPSSLKALRTMERLLAGVDRERVHFSVRDLSLDPDAGDADRIAFTPTLVKQAPEPRAWIRGDLQGGEVVTDLLRFAGLEGRAGA